MIFPFETHYMYLGIQLYNGMRNYAHTVYIHVIYYSIKQKRHLLAILQSQKWNLTKGWVSINTFCMIEHQ